MSTPALLAVAALCGITAQRLCVQMRARLRSRRWIGYLRYSIGERNPHTIPGSSPPLISSRPSTGSGHALGMDAIEG